MPYFVFKKFQDPAWNYRLFPWDRILSHAAFERYAAVDAADLPHGFLALSLGQSRIKVEFVAAAPWNHGATRLRSGIGSGLLGLAIQRSIGAGFGGALVLSSTPESETFYEKMGLSRTGQVDREGLSVFELAALKAPTVLARYPALATAGGAHG